jgi:catechol 2,3-dioxygenase-like lactoylglutathione lyase family enzyme
MEHRIHVVTLAVEDLERSLVFYRDGLGFESPGVIGTEHPGDAKNAAGAVVMFELAGGLVLALYPRSELAKDANVDLETASSSSFSLGHIVPERQDVDALLAAAAAAGARITEAPRTRPWGIYSGYFRDLDGHLWEIIWDSTARSIEHP